MDDWQTGILSSSLLLGATVGSAAGGDLSDRLGRKKVWKIR